MNDEPIILPDAVPTPTTHQRFPAVAQFFVLVLLLGGLLGGVVFPYLVPPKSPAPTAAVAVSQGDAEIPVLRELSVPSLEAKAVFVYDVATNRTLYSENPDAVLPLASVAKLMTALVSHELLADDATVVVPAGATSQTSASGLLLGERFAVSELRDYAMLASSNDAAYTLASGVGKKLAESTPQEAFVAAMNITAEELNLMSLRFSNPTGLDLSPSEAGAYGSARDVSFLMSYIVRNYPDILTPTTMAYERIYNTDGAFHEAENTNPSINAIPNLLGSKTGYTDLANGNLTIAFDAGYNRPIIITVLGSSYEGRFRDVLALVASVQEAFSTLPE